ncbi:type IV secretion system protein [Xylella fastidiosa]|uniref:Conjugal transfer protein n=2 Tax=Xylella fastidiosa TaxID=2371 RepID=Q9PHJ4_XYLFA|nr:type IV secretion system protein [Xylella fastidiosa]AAF85580.1 conjugal transfer protein [Xylella fastidiosa 9a5c]ALQ95993.1 conjugal transfer protein [Xylella fastidiosa]ALR03232.1 conjugal transfer protein [Xylella fastidiosa]KXB10327.1 conjugal transfer protein [Xylella fastidiosa]KXB18633.1 conjugal transfer protein [Xylella fastidiosa]
MGASVASNFHFYSRMFTELSNALNTYVNDTAANIIGAITPVATTLLTIYVILWGWSMMRGVISEPITDGVGRIVRLAVICGIALKIGYYNGFISDFLWNAPDEMANYLGGRDGESNAAFLDTLMSKMYDFGDTYYQKAQANTTLGVPNLGFLFMGYGIWAAGILATGYGAFLLALAKMGLAITLGIGPIFVLLIMFEPTKRFFDAWLGQTLNYVFLVMLTAAAIKLIMTILEKYLTSAMGVDVDPSLDKALPAIVFSIIGALVMVQMPSKASALGGGVAISTLGAVAFAYGKAKGSMSAMRPTNLRRSFNKARSDFRIARDAVRSTAGMPLAVYRKVTGANKNRVARR